MTIIVKSIMICDDIRIEMSQKEILIGVYTGTVNFNGKSPGKIRQLIFRIELSIDDNVDNFGGEFCLTSPSRSIMMTKSFNVQSEAADNEEIKRAVVAVASFDTVFYEPGIYTMAVSISNEKFEENFSVRFAEG